VPLNVFSKALFLWGGGWYYFIFVSWN